MGQVAPGLRVRNAKVPKQKKTSAESQLPVVDRSSRSSKPTNTSPADRLNAIVQLVVDTAEAKGWKAQVAAEDSKAFKYATVAVARTAPGTYQEVTGTFEITSDDRLRITYHGTSFYSYGLKDLYDAIANEFWKLPWVKKSEEKGDSRPSDVELVERLLRRFHRAARQLKHRHAEREPLLIKDEYDVQDILHAFLRGLFDDIRPEEYAPSYAGGASRMDFLLKSEQIVIETKFASATLRDKQVGEQLMIDIQRYRAHPDCKKLVCFVYDAEGFIKNPSGLEADLTRTHDGMAVKVIVLSN
jgi:hypothetical protein